MVVAAALRRLAGGEVIRGEETQHTDHRIVEAGADGIASPGTAAAHQGRAHAERALKAGDQIGDRRPGAHRRAIGLAGHAHKPAHRLGDEIEGGPVAIGSAGAKAGEAATDQRGVQRLEPSPVKAHRRHDPGSEILDQHIAARDQLFEHRAAITAAQIQGQRALVAVERREIPAQPVPHRPLPAHRVARARGFDLDHLGPHIGQDHRAERPGQNARQIDHADTRQRHAPPPFWL